MTDPATEGLVSAAWLAQRLGDPSVKVLDGTTRTTGGVGDHTTGDGLVAKCRVTNFSINQSLEEAVTVSVSLKPTYGTAPIWQS